MTTPENELPQHPQAAQTQPIPPVHLSLIHI